MNKKITVIFPLSSMSQRTRLDKLAQVCNDLNIEITTWRWLRNYKDKNIEKAKVTKQKTLLIGGGFSSKRLKIYYLLWVISVFFRVIVFKPKSTVYCLGFESALPIWMANKITKIPYIFDDADRFSLIVKMPKKIDTLIKELEKKVSEESLVNIIPGLERYEFRNNKQFILKNMPDSKTLNKAKEITPQNFPNQVVIYVNGRMVEERGMPVILALAKIYLTNPAIQFIAAGYAIGPSAQEFIKLRNVKYIGEVANATALAWYRVSDFAFTYYNPIIEINKYAESNKWGDCLALGVVPIVNEEVITAEFLREKNLCISSAYHDVDDLKKKIDIFINNKELLSSIKAKVLQEGSNIKHFDKEILCILKSYI